MRKLYLIVLSATLILLVGYIGLLSYWKAKETRLMAMARQFAAQSDTRNAILSLTEVLRLNPNNLEATRMMTTLAEAARQPNALLWRSRLVELDPHSVAER